MADLQVDPTSEPPGGTRSPFAGLPREVVRYDVVVAVLVAAVVIAVRLLPWAAWTGQPMSALSGTAADLALGLVGGFAVFAILLHKDAIAELRQERALYEAARRRSESLADDNRAWIDEAMRRAG